MTFSHNISQKTDSGELKTILTGCAEYCRKLDRASLHFTCLEDIRERVYFVNKQEDKQSVPGSRVTYKMNTMRYHEIRHTFDYQLIRQDSVKERKRLIEKNGKPGDSDMEEFEPYFFYHQYVIFGPVGIFGKKWQEFYNYTLVEKTRFKRENVYVVDARPKYGSILGHMFGKAWISASDYSVLKIEWDQRSLGKFDIILEKAASIEATPDITLISEYGIEKNGLRFPSRYIIREDYIFPFRRKYRNSETLVSYKNYKFFMVETDVSNVREKK
ncbi:MAG: hypothetical protein L6425_09355 [Candidatus Aminicenantes bacterium]|nr:hypothetical protein [Candidatus Aminicenantes bacterium]